MAIPQSDPSTLARLPEHGAVATLSSLDSIRYQPAAPGVATQLLKLYPNFDHRFWPIARCPGPLIHNHFNRVATILRGPSCSTPPNNSLPNSVTAYNVSTTPSAPKRPMSTGSVGSWPLSPSINPGVSWSNWMRRKSRPASASRIWLYRAR